MSSKRVFKYYIVIIGAIIFISCSPKVYLKYGEKSNKFFGVYEGKHTVIQNKDTVSLTEIKYITKISTSLTSRAMFDHYGIWDNEVSDKENITRILIWRQIDFFNNGQHFNIATTGLENEDIQYASVIVTNNLNQDVLVNNSKLKDKIIIKMRALMDSVNLRNKAFSKVYNRHF